MPKQIDVFLSRPTRVGPEFGQGLEAFLRLLDTAGLKPRTVGATDYPSTNPLSQVIKVMRQCRGAIVLGYPQVTVLQGSIRDSKLPSPISLATEWNHIEAGLAYAMGIPLLVIHHTGVIRGIFDRGATDRFVYARDLTNPGWPLTPDIAGAVRTWRDDVLAQGNPSRAVSADQKPTCPNCAQEGKTLYLTLASWAEKQSYGAAYSCPRCSYKE